MKYCSVFCERISSKKEREGMANKYLIDGRFLASMSTGIDRYAYQVLSYLDSICEDLDISILVPGSVREIPAYQNIKVIQSKKERCWTQLVYGGYARIHRMIPINLCNEVSVIARKGIVCLHDVCYAETPDVYPGVNEFPPDEIKWFLKLYQRIKRKAAVVITVSEFSKERINQLVGIKREQIVVIGNGWQHFQKIQENPELLKNYSKLVDGNFYFTLTSANKNKNLAWVLRCAKVHSEEIFAVAGKNLERQVDFDQYPNIVYLGYASDELAKTMMRHCKAFIFPSYYEGFGIPPLEALSTGARIIISDRASLPEIFLGTAHYISPDYAGVDLNQLLREPVDEPDNILDKYSWEHAAEKLHSILRDYGTDMKGVSHE